MKNEETQNEEMSFEKRLPSEKYVFTQILI